MKCQEVDSEERELQTMNNSTNEDIQFLIDLQNKLKYQSEHDYDCQASPRFWTLMDYRKTPADPDYDSGEHEYFHNDGDYTRFDDYSDLKDFVKEYYEDAIEEDEDLKELLEDEYTTFEDLWEYIDDNLNGDRCFGKVFVKEEEFIVQNTMFLTKEEAKRHIELNHYHYTSKVHTYAMSAWRAPQVERVLNILEHFDWNKVEIKK